MFIGYWNKSVILTYLGVIFGVMGIIFSFGKEFDYAIICLILAGICDLFDGYVARKCTRNNKEKEFGIQIDSLADIINFGILPIILFISYGFNKYYCYLVYFIYIICQVSRLAFFNINTSIDKKTNFYKGLPVTFSALIFPLTYLFLYHLSFNYFMNLSIVIMLFVAILNISNIKIKKPTGIFYFIFSFLAVIVISLLVTNYNKSSHFFQKS